MVNGEPYEVDFQQMAEAGVASLLLNHRSLEAFVEEREDAWEVLIQGELYMVQVEDERVHRLSQARGTVTAVTGEATIISPMPGIIIAVSVVAGDEVAKGQKVVILESRKMEDVLTAPREGRVLRVNVAAGSSGERGRGVGGMGEVE
jgi:acetyl/propionyl-CoA carboxylase alpha subunit